MNTRYFNMDDYAAIPAEDRKLVDDWANKHDLLELNVLLIQEDPGGQGLVVSGLGKDYDGDSALSRFDHKEVARLPVDDFPWDVLNNIPAPESQEI